MEAMNMLSKYQSSYGRPSASQGDLSMGMQDSSPQVESYNEVDGGGTPEISGLDDLWHEMSLAMECSQDGDFGTKRPKVDQGERGEVLRDHLVEHKTIGLDLHSASTRMDIDTCISNVDLHPRMDEPGIDQLPKEMHEMTIGDNKTIHQKDKEITPTMVNTNKGESGHVISTTIGGRNGQPKQIISYMAENVVGTGSFGVVFQAKCIETGETVAIKKVLQDKRYKNRELQIMHLLDHPNVVQLKHYFFSTTDNDELYLNLVLEYVPETIYRMVKHYHGNKQHMPLIYIQLYTYQICRGLAYIHGVLGVCHRDIKPQNILVNPQSHQVKLCDFGSAKKLVPGEPNISYICSRYYRAPELIFGAIEYSNAIDMWSVGCVLAELLLGQPLFPGESGIDQLVVIIKILGTPTREEMKCMNPNHTEYNFPQVKGHPWHKLFDKQMPHEAVDLVSRLLQYSPNMRCTALEACSHPFFDALRDPNARLPNGRRLPPLFDFTPRELDGASPELIERLIPGSLKK